VVCVKNEGYAASLEKRKLYVALRDLAAEKHGLSALSMNPATITSIQRLFFRPVALPLAIKKAIVAAA